MNSKPFSNRNLHNVITQMKLDKVFIESKVQEVSKKNNNFQKFKKSNFFSNFLFFSSSVWVNCKFLVEMGNDFIESVLKKSVETKEILKKEEFDSEDMKFVLKNNFNIELGRLKQEEPKKGK